MSTPITALLFTDPGCPWAYSANPALRVLEWRYGSQLDWRIRLIGLAEDPAEYEAKGFTPELMLGFNERIHGWYGMPFLLEPKSRMAATSPACRVVVAARLDHPGREREVLRVLQLAQFTSATLMDSPEDLVAALEAAAVDGIDAATLVGRIDDADVWEAYEQDRAAARAAEGTPGAMQGKTAGTPEGGQRYTAPSIRFIRGDRELEAAGFQPVEAYDVLLANLDPRLERADAPKDERAALERFPSGLTTQEVALLLHGGHGTIDRAGVRARLEELAAAGVVTRIELGNDAAWRIAG